MSEVWLILILFAVAVAIPILLVVIAYLDEYGEKLVEGLQDRRIRGAACVILVVMVALFCTYVQDVGTVVVVRNWDGTVACTTAEAGLHVKAPWPLQSRLKWSTGNLRLSFSKEYYKMSSWPRYWHGSRPECIYDNGSCSGESVAVADSSGARAEVDMQVVYSLDGVKVGDLYLEYGDQEAFVSGYLFKDARAVVAETAGSFDSIALLTDRARYSAAVKDALAERWRDLGITVEAVQVQDVRLEDSAGED